MTKANQKCNIQECKLEKYEQHNECILHCKKEIKFIYNTHINDFYIELQNTIENLKSNYVFSKIHFPVADIQGKNYNNLFGNFDKLHFISCHFYDTNLYLSLKTKVYFSRCTFENDWDLQDYPILENKNKAIYAGCIFNKNVNFYPQLDKDNNKNISNIQFDDSCKFNENIKIENAIIHKNVFNNTQENISNEEYSSPNPRDAGGQGNMIITTTNEAGVKNETTLTSDKKNNAVICPNFGNKVEFLNCDFINKQEFYLNSNPNTEFIFYNCEFKEKLKIRNTETGGDEANQQAKAHIKKLKIKDCTAKDETYLRIGFLKVDDFVLSNLRLPPNSELNIGDCYFKKFQLTNFRNVGKFKLFNTNIFNGETGDEFQIDNTSIGKADFQSVNLTSFEKVIMFDNIFVEIDYSNVQWKEKNIEVGKFGKSDKVKIAKKRDTYRSLKNIASRNNDQPQALRFYVEEMKKHRKLTIENNSPLKLNRITLAFNYWTNDFGLNWWRPIWLLLAISMIAYILLLFSLDSKIGGFNYSNIELFFNKYLVFLDPLHKTEDISKLPWGFYSYLINFLFRIIEGLFIYQTIQAFRKYSRKL
jgi:ribosomal protein L21